MENIMKKFISGAIIIMKISKVQWANVQRSMYQLNCTM